MILMHFSIVLLLLLLIRPIKTLIVRARVRIIKDFDYIPSQPKLKIGSVFNSKSSYLYCISICNRHSTCRTATFNINNNLCSMYEDNDNVGKLIVKENSTVLAFNYCDKPEEIEPYYICSATGSAQLLQVHINQLNLLEKWSTTSGGVVFYENYFYFEDNNAEVLNVYKMNGNNKIELMWTKHIGWPVGNIRTNKMGNLYIVSSTGQGKAIKLDSDGNILQTYTIPDIDGLIDDVVIYNGYLWFNNELNSVIVKINESNGDIIQKYNLEPIAYSLTYFNQQFWTTDATGIIYNWNYNKNVLTPWINDLNYFPIDDIVANGLVQDYGGRRYVCNYERIPDPNFENL
ncbi:unnamed protein product [Didymodactylos carnosus]|uniref:Apple domain-containing protein n=1 Tax=Didymodactylos carnosus TaxID=1234261 RepID=A0A814FW17_9BILA|nr:unnamed protein product [Didymodactylos carnosus]CAF0985666.1 unnamed protein product [Didymodactylos carnosus]CAF3607103.1 unnamed protein product [Didymodactylos carnosus]CAF3757959.1 unnamed protein product [Didymodactylos carnosus]